MPKQLVIVHDPSPVLHTKAKEINIKICDFAKLNRLAQDMILTMKQANGVGLAAPQIGISTRLIVVEYLPEPLVLINPEIIKHSLRKVLLEEGCLSVPGKQGLVKRWTTVKVRAITFKDNKPHEVTIEAKGLLAHILQHEIDHTNGILFTDIATKVF